ncbi:hypothetical protein Q9966_012669 [Columba livia]|nr:hypothetical protein Q9966_012669 [Columba livia]
MAEVAGMYSSGEYDLAGFVVGAVERGQMVLGLQRAEEEDVLIGLASSGIHGHGFSIIRKILLMSSLHYSSPAPGSCGDKTLGDILLTPAKMYSPSLLPVLRSGHVKAFAFIAEEGLVEAISRILPEHVSAVLDALSWKIPEIFCWLYKEGNLSEEEMAQTFNCGIGAVLVVQKDLAQHVLKDIQRHEEAWLIGKVAASCHTGTNLAALISYAKEPGSCAQVVLVISNKSGVEELRNAARAGIPTRNMAFENIQQLDISNAAHREPFLLTFNDFEQLSYLYSYTQVIDHKLYGSRSEFDSTIDQVLEEFAVELICLSGFMRILSGPFLRKWKVKDGNAHQQALQSGFKGTGCTVHFVLEESSPKAVIHQEPVSVKADDTEETLSERVKEAECRAFPIALQLVASGAVRLGADGKTCWKQESQSLCLQEEMGTSSLMALEPPENNVV